MRYSSLIQIERAFDERDLHTVVWRMAEENHGDNDRKFLFRADKMKLANDRDGLLLYVLSENPLQDLRLKSIKILKSKPYELPSLSGILTLRSRASIRRGHKDAVWRGLRENQGMLVSEVARKEWDDWWKIRAQDFGIEVLETSVVQARQHAYEHRTGFIRHYSVDGTATVRVTDADKLRQLFHDGIGSNKAHGFGLLLVED